MQMDGIGTVCLFDKPYNGLTTFGHPEGRAGRNAVIAYQAGLAQVGVNLLLQ
jgi:hypothetical protein